MAYGFKATTEVDVSLPFNCESCRAQGEATFRAVGRSGSVRSSMFSGGDDGAIADAQTAANQDLEGDQQRVLAMVPCPTCGHRNGRTGAFVRVGLLVAAAGLLAFISGGDGGFIFTGAVVLGICALIVAYTSIDAFRRGTAVKLSAFTPGTRRPTPKPPAKPTPELPAARVVSTPSAKPPVIVPAVAPAPRAEAPLPPPPADGGPRLLR